jgi:hypothetical protein
MTDEELDLLEDGRRWRRFWSPEMCEMRARQYEAAIGERLREAAVAISQGREWGRGIPFEVLRYRRSLPAGDVAHRTMARPIDREALARWVATGSSEPRRAAA